MTQDGEVTSLGQHLVRLPCDVRLGKLLVMGSVLGCPWPAAALAGCLSVRSPLLRGDEDTDQKRHQLRRSLRPGGGRSDHCMLAQLGMLWAEANGREGRRQLCSDYGV